MTINGILDAARSVLQGEPLRAIGYGAGVIIYLVAKAMGSIEDLPLDQAILQAGAAAAIVASVIETMRRMVYSPASVIEILEETKDPQAAAEEIEDGAPPAIPAEDLP